MRVKELREKIGEFLSFLSETSNKGELMENHPWDKKNSQAVEDARKPYPKRAVAARSYIKRKYDAAKLLSGTGNTSAAVTPDGVSIVFQSVKHSHTIHWPMAGWPELKKWIDEKYEK